MKYFPVFNSGLRPSLNTGKYFTSLAHYTETVYNNLMSTLSISSSKTPPSTSLLEPMVLYCTVLYCTVLYCTVLYYFVLYITSLDKTQYSTVLTDTALVTFPLYDQLSLASVAPLPWLSLDRTVQYSTVQYSTVQYSTVQYSTVQYSTVQYSTVQYSVAPLLCLSLDRGNTGGSG